MDWVPCSFGNFKSGDLWLALITFLYVSSTLSSQEGMLCWYCRHATLS